MSDHDPREFLVLCESIMEDGELTNDELYRLAEWLNSHQEACYNWPRQSPRGAVTESVGRWQGHED